jgi:hypothetical protein
LKRKEMIMVEVKSNSKRLWRSHLRRRRKRQTYLSSDEVRQEAEASAIG